MSTPVLATEGVNPHDNVKDSQASTRPNPALVLSHCNNDKAAAPSPIYLQEDWTRGIGGGLWSMGVALAKYLDTPHAQSQLRRHSEPLQVLELGSGNGFLGVCFLASCLANKNMVQRLVITDTKEHLPLIEQTLQVNPHILRHFKKDDIVQVEEYLWGEDASKLCVAQADSKESSSSSSSFDYIIGSDLAYRDELHDPLIQALLDCSSAQTVTLLGVTMNDTKLIFFQKLAQAGFLYERLADHLIDPNYQGFNFGIFVIRKQQQQI